MIARISEIANIQTDGGVSAKPPRRKAIGISFDGGPRQMAGDAPSKFLMSSCSRPHGVIRWNFWPYPAQDVPAEAIAGSSRPESSAMASTLASTSSVEA